MRTTAELDRALTELVQESRGRMPSRLAGRDRNLTVASALMFVLVACGLAAVVPWERTASPLTVALLIGLHALASRSQFELGPGTAVPTQVTLVPMLFVLPAGIIPLCVAAAYLLGAAPEVVGRRLHLERAFVLLAGSWHAVGPALVLAAAGQPSFDLRDWPIYAAALAAQIGFDLASTLAREVLAFGVRLRLLLPVLACVYAVDCLLTPLGLVTVAALDETRFAYLSSLPLLALLLVFARDRRQRIDAVVELTNAYRSANQEARRDALTGLGNRLAWEEALGRAEERLAAGAPVSLLVLDVDRLKAANDVRGHHFGDEVLRTAAAVVRGAVRESDVVARTGGDEIAVLMPNTDERGAASTVSRLATALDEHPGLDGFPLSAAIGYASCPPAHSLVEAVATADARMYDQKPKRRAARLVGIS